MKLLYYNGGLSACREALKKAGGVEVTFPRNMDIFPYLKRNGLCIYIDEGYLDARLLTPGVGIYEPISYARGSFLIGEVFWGQEFSLAHYELVPSVCPLKGLILPRQALMEKCSSHTDLWTGLFQSIKEISYVNAVNTMLFHVGQGTNRVCNYLWIYDILYQTYQDIPYITQEKIAHKTLLSQSQITRILNQLRKRQIIGTCYRRIQILDRERISEFLSPLCLEPNFIKTIQ